MELKDELLAYRPYNEQEERDRELFLEFLDRGDLIYTRESREAHITASAWVTNRERDKILMAYHNIYDSWAWLGGHADGEKNLLWVARKEAMEESGIQTAVPVMEEIFSIEILTVPGHMKKGRYVSSHLHLNVTYLLEAGEEEILSRKEDENSAVRWFLTEEGIEASKEPWMRTWVYRKLAEKMKSCVY